jgi:hypothetical protein
MSKPQGNLDTETSADINIPLRATSPHLRAQSRFSFASAQMTSPDPPRRRLLLPALRAMNPRFIRGILAQDPAQVGLPAGLFMPANFFSPPASLAGARQHVISPIFLSGLDMIFGRDRRWSKG